MSRRMDEADPTTIDLDNVGTAFALVVAAGLCTAVGAAAIFEQRVVSLANKQVLAMGLGFAAGVMLYVSFTDIFSETQAAFVAGGLTERDAYFCTTLCLFSGMALFRLLDGLVHLIDPVEHELHEHRANDSSREGDNFEITIPPLSGHEEVFAAARAVGAESGLSRALPPSTAPRYAAPPGPAPLDMVKAERAAARQLQRVGVNTAVALAMHNLPEGLAGFVATLSDPHVGATLAIAVGVHNIPEGLCVALPIFYSTNSRMKGFMYALLSGASEPLGALIGYCIIKSTGNDIHQLVYGVLFGIVAGMMIMIVIMALLPTAYKYDPEDRYASRSVMIGMAVMAASLCLFIA